jgi:hypothetical protein
MSSAPKGAPHNLPVGLSPGHVPGFFFAWLTWQLRCQFTNSAMLSRKSGI